MGQCKCGNPAQRWKKRCKECERSAVARGIDFVRNGGQRKVARKIAGIDNRAFSEHLRRAGIRPKKIRCRVCGVMFRPPFNRPTNANCSKSCRQLWANANRLSLGRPNSPKTESRYKRSAEVYLLTGMTVSAVARDTGVDRHSLRFYLKRNGLIDSGESKNGHRPDKAAVETRKRIRDYKGGAVARGLDWEISSEYFATLIAASCEYCGGEGGGVDRINSGKGYIPGNVVPCCKVCNMMKRDYHVGDFLSHAKRIAAHCAS